MAVESQVSLQNKFSGFSEPADQSPACNDPFKECGDWLFTDNVATQGTTGNTDHDTYIDAKISQTSHFNFSRAHWSH